MQISEIRIIAKQHGIDPTNKSKPVLIREIQHKEGDFACFSTSINRFCNQLDCPWRTDCLTTA